jgi:hypothetical protein
MPEPGAIGIGELTDKGVSVGKLRAKAALRFATPTRAAWAASTKLGAGHPQVNLAPGLSAVPDSWSFWRLGAAMTVEILRSR